MPGGDLCLLIVIHSFKGGHEVVLQGEIGMRWSLME